MRFYQKVRFYMKKLKYEADVKNWLLKAEEDLKWARSTLRGRFYTQVCFVAQQVAEKSLKAFLLSCDVVPLKTHSLPVLLKECSANKNDFEQFKNKVEILDKYYAPTRYPDLGLLEGYSPKTAEEALMIATEIFGFVKGTIDL